MTEVIGSMVSKCVISYLYMVYIGAITHLLTIDPNFLGHPSTVVKQPSVDFCSCYFP